MSRSGPGSCWGRQSGSSASARISRWRHGPVHGTGNRRCTWYHSWRWRLPRAPARWPGASGSAWAAAAVRAFCFWAGWGVLAVALLSPVHALGEVLFSAHMVQHELLMLVAAPLMVLSRPLAPFVRALPFAWRRAVGRWSKLRP